MFSIIIPTYNRASFLPRAIQSVLAQIYENWELLIVDDGSIDNTREVVATFKDERIRYIYQQNAERSAARNNGISKAKGEWICFLDSDDEYLPNHLMELNNKISTIITPTLVLTGNLIVSSKETKKHPLIQTEINFILKEILTKFILMNSVCVHKSILEYNKFDIRFKIWEDTHLWMRIAAQFPVYQINKFTCIQHVHDDSTVQQGMKQIKLAEVNQYVEAIADLRDNYKRIFKGKLSEKEFDSYIQSKYEMYLYQARQNKQLWISLKIWFKAIIHRPSFYLISELPKIFINQFNIGIHNDR